MNFQKVLRKTAVVLLSSVIALILLWGILAPARTVRAAGPWYVAPGGSDANACQSPLAPCATINTALTLAAPGDTVYVATGVYTAAEGEQVVLIDKSVTLSGGWSSDFSRQDGMATLDGQQTRRGMLVQGAIDVSVERFIVTRGVAIQGAGIYHSSAALTLTQVWVHGNTGGHEGYSGGGGGGGIASLGSLTLNQSTVSGNRLLGFYSGAGIYAAGEVSINNSTISGNDGGEAIYVSGGPVNLNSSTLVCGNGYICGIRREFGVVRVRNSVLHSGNGTLCAGVVTSLGYNVANQNTCVLEPTDRLVDPQLAPLRHHSGWMPSHALQAGSPAINAADPAGCSDVAGQPLAFDQHGTPRLGRCDVGAVEASYAMRLSFGGVTLPGRVMTQKVTLQNVSQWGTISHVVLTETLPASLRYEPGTLTFSNGSGAVVSNTLTWSGDILTTADTLIRFDALISPTLPVGSRITNTVTGLWQGVRSRAEAGFETREHAYLPLCLRIHCVDFFDNFSQPSSGWPIAETASARYGYINGEYQILSRAPAFFLVKAPTCTRENYTVEADVRWEGERGGTIGLLFGIKGDFDQFYLFDINVDNKVIRLLRANADGSITTLRNWYLVYTIYNTTHLKVEYNGGQITLFINSSTVTVPDPAPITGLTGVGIISSPYGDVPISDARFDNFRAMELPSDGVAGDGGAAGGEAVGQLSAALERLGGYLLRRNPLRAR